MNEETQAFEEATYRKVAWRLMPLLLICYIVAYLDRVNVGFAKLQMMQELGFSDVVYGLGAGIFFIGYFIFEVPSNIVLHKIGARVWIGRIMITWGILSAAMMYVNSSTMFYVMRFMLGVAEAGEVAPAHVVGHHEHDVGPRRRSGGQHGAGEGDKAGREEAEEVHGGGREGKRGRRSGQNVPFTPNVQMLPMSR